MLYTKNLPRERAGKNPVTIADKLQLDHHRGYHDCWQRSIHAEQRRRFTAIRAHSPRWDGSVFLVPLLKPRPRWADIGRAQRFIVAVVVFSLLAGLAVWI